MGMHSTEERSGSSPVMTRLFAVIVVYKMHPLASSTLQTLLASVDNASSDNFEIKILVWDNTPGGQDVEMPSGILYQSAPHNPGLAQAYNQALEQAEAGGYEWLLTLDQDSRLPVDFLARIANFTRQLGPDKTIGAIVPQVISDGRIVSPFRFIFGVPRWFGLGFVGPSKRAAYAANSGSTLRVCAVREIGGYNPMFPLDLSDTDLFHRLHDAGKSVFVAGDVLVDHNFALLNKHVRMSIERYKESLLDDCAFWDIYMGPVARFERIIRFAGRACKDLSRFRESAFWKPTLLELKRRLFTPRQKRIAEWRKLATLRCSNSLQASGGQPIALRQGQPNYPES
jgi:GT2 family glycosyltransferase